MKRVFTSLLVVFIGLWLKSCMVIQPAALKGKYQDPPYVVEIDKPFSEAWEDAIDFVAINGWKMSILDKANGLIWTERYSYRTKTTIEVLEKAPLNPKAWVVISPLKDQVKMKKPVPFIPYMVEGEINLRFRAISEKKTRLYIDFVNLRAEHPSGTKLPNVKFPIESMGQLEEFIAGGIKK